MLEKYLKDWGKTVILNDKTVPWVERVFYYNPRGKTFYPK